MKIGTIHLQKILAAYHKTENLQKEIREVEKIAQKELDDRIATFKAFVGEVQKLQAQVNNLELSKNTRDAARIQFQQKSKNVRPMEQEVNNFRITRQRQIQEQMLRLRKGLVDEVLAVVNDRTKTDGYDLVIDRSALSAHSAPIAIFAREDMDFSDAVIAALNAGAPQTPA